MTARYVVIATEADGSQTAWGPFSAHRADVAAAAFEASGSDNARVLVLNSAADLGRELPDWKRVVA